MSKIVDAIIEVPKNTNLKYEFDKKNNMITVSYTHLTLPTKA